MTSLVPQQDSYGLSLSPRQMPTGRNSGQLSEASVFWNSYGNDKITTIKITEALEYLLALGTVTSVLQQ